MGTTQHSNTNMTDAKPAAKKAAKPKAPAAHPKYSVMIAAAIAALKDRTGSSRQAILKYVCANYKVGAAKAGQHLRMALKAGIKKGPLKMAKKPKAAKKPAAKKAAVKKPAAKKAAKKPAAKKAAPAKKAAAKKPAAKKPAANKA